MGYTDGDKRPANKMRSRGEGYGSGESVTVVSNESTSEAGDRRVSDTAGGRRVGGVSC